MQQLAAKMTGLSNYDLEFVCSQAGIDQTPVAMVSMVYALRELAIRFDKRSFINIQEAIALDIECGVPGRHAPHRPIDIAA